MKKRRFIATLLVLALAVCVFPVSAFASNLVASSGSTGTFTQKSTVYYTDVNNHPAARSFPATSTIYLIQDLYSSDTYAVGSCWDPIGIYRVETGRVYPSVLSFS